MGVTDKAIKFQAQVFKVQTVVDGGIRLTLDLSASNAETIIQLIQAMQPGIMLEIAAVAVKQESIRQDAKVSTRSEWQSERAPD